MSDRPGAALSVVAVLIAGALLAAPAAAQYGGPPEGGRRGGAGGAGGGSMTGVANPSAVIGAEIAFARLAQDKGQWTAFRDTAAEQAIMFVPGRVAAPGWLKGRANPPVAVKWQVHEVWMSCDGSYAVSRGAWQRPGSTGVFNTVWQRQRKGDYKWVLDLGETLAAPLAAPDMIAGRVSDCRNRPRRSLPMGVKHGPKGPTPIDPADGQSEDGTLRWHAQLDAKAAGTFVVSRWNGSGYDEAERLTLSGS